MYRTVPVVATIFVVCSCWKRKQISVLQIYTWRVRSIHQTLKYSNSYFFNVLLVSYDFKLWYVNFLNTLFNEHLSHKNLVNWLVYTDVSHFLYRNYFAAHVLPYCAQCVWVWVPLGKGFLSWFSCSRFLCTTKACRYRTHSNPHSHLERCQAGKNSPKLMYKATCT